MARKITHWDFQKDEYGNSWYRGRNGLELENFRINLEWRRRKHAPRTVRRVIYEGDVALAEVEGEERAFAYVHELMEDRVRWEHQRLQWWRVRFNVWKGRDLIEKDDEMFVQAASLVRAAEYARLKEDDENGGYVEVLWVRKANYSEIARLQGKVGPQWVPRKRYQGDPALLRLRTKNVSQKASQREANAYTENPTKRASDEGTGLEQQSDKRNEHNRQNH